MKRVELNLEYFNNTYGLSCVENILLYILNANKVATPLLYFSSFLTIAEIEKSMISTATYAAFDGVKRLQDVAVEEKIIDMQFMDGRNLEGVGDSLYCCAMIDPAFIQDKYNTKLWRSDHYILISPSCTQGYDYINDYPRDIKHVSILEFERYYSGKAILIKLCDEQPSNDPTVYISRMTETLKPDDPSYSISCTDVLILRDIIGILRILRKRLFALFSLKYDLKFMTSYLNYLDRCYAALEYMRVKQKYDMVKISNMIREIVDLDRQSILNIMYIAKQ